MKRLVSIDFACNDPDNGLFDRKAMMASYGDNELEPRNWGGFTFTVGDGFVRIHRRKFQFTSSKDWLGNWCWNRYWFKRSEAKRLLNTLRKNGWRCTSGPTRWYRWFNGGDDE